MQLADEVEVEVLSGGLLVPFLQLGEIRTPSMLIEPAGLYRYRPHMQILDLLHTHTHTNTHTHIAVASRSILSKTSWNHYWQHAQTAVAWRG
jgi:hypothetical protein